MSLSRRATVKEIAQARLDATLGLRVSLLHSIQLYETNDNPVPSAPSGVLSRALASTASLFGLDGAKGREQAGHYKRLIQSAFQDNEDILACQLINELKQDALLSHSLRLRLLEALRDYYGVTNDEFIPFLNKHIRRHNEKMIYDKNYALTGGRSDCQLRGDALLELTEQITSHQLDKVRNTVQGPRHAVRNEDL